MSRAALVVGLFYCAAAVAAGAFGAHALASRLEPRPLELWETAARYLMYGGLCLGLLGVAMAGRSSSTIGTLSVSTLAFGTLVFWATVAALALGGPRLLGAVTPIGGTLMIVGLVAAAVWALRSF